MGSFTAPPASGVNVRPSRKRTSKQSSFASQRSFASSLPMANTLPPFHAPGTSAPWNEPSLNQLSSPVSWPIHSRPSRSSNKLVTRRLCKPGVLLLSNTLKWTPSNRTNPLYVPSHR
jgi:hypothetical protein